MADLNTKVYFNYSTPDSTDAEETERLVEDAGGSAKGARVNVASRQEVQEFFSQIVKECGRVDVLVNNAGTTKDGLMVRMKEEDWDRVLGINLKGADYDEAAVRAHHKYNLRGRCHGKRRTGQLCRIQGRPDRLDQDSRQRIGPKRNYG
jgi:NAD(P)-dependent dehydrogenase (short-subunit alcohol dehydrogenase family)